MYETLKDSSPAVRHCECEHRTHAEACHETSDRRVRTDYGLYHICKTCYDLGHMTPYSEVRHGK